MSNSIQVPTPLHLQRDAEGQLLPAKRKPGRPVKLPAPVERTPSEWDYIAEVNRLRDEHVEADQLVQALESNAPSAEILSHAIQELAVESAAIRYEILCDQAAGKVENLPQKHSRRIDALSKISLTMLSMNKLNLIEFDLHNPDVQRIYQFFLQTVLKVADQTLASPSEFSEKCKEALAGWEERVEQE